MLAGSSAKAEWADIVTVLSSLTLNTAGPGPNRTFKSKEVIYSQFNVEFNSGTGSQTWKENSLCCCLTECKLDATVAQYHLFRYKAVLSDTVGPCKLASFKTSVDFSVKFVHIAPLRKNYIYNINAKREHYCYIGLPLFSLIFSSLFLSVSYE